MPISISNFLLIREFDLINTNLLTFKTHSTIFFCMFSWFCGLVGWFGALFGFHLFGRGFFDCAFLLVFCC